MSLADLWGSTLLLQALFAVCAVLAAAVFIAPLVALFYQRYWYPRVMLPRFNPAYTPRCAIIIPCKGAMKNLDKTVQAYAKMDYPDFEVIYAVESQHDPAAAVIQAGIREHSHASLVVAGLAQQCAQKNWNLLSAVRKAANPDVLVFADADITPNSRWLRNLVLPLSSPGITATSGFRWLTPRHGTLGEHNHAFFNAFLYILFSIASFVGNVGLWGGAMAIRRKDFEELGVATRWAETAVDDLSLAEIIMKNRRASVIVPPCITFDNDAIAAVGASMRWIERQMMFLKMYHTHLWLAATPTILFALVMLLWLPIAAIVAATTPYAFLGLGGGGPLLLALADVAACMWYPLLGKMPHFGAFLLKAPLVRYLQLLSLERTVLTNTITWSGVKYRVKVSSGKVVELQRPPTAAGGSPS